MIRRLFQKNCRRNDDAVKINAGQFWDNGSFIFQGIHKNFVMKKVMKKHWLFKIRTLLMTQSCVIHLN